ncbi:MAG TPA: septum site-determining protein MinC [Gammaproteobacteria bacterium]|nr:septum site-determining protein MinC [Gammaproteobacteria bacterium]
MQTDLETTGAESAPRERVTAVELKGAVFTLPVLKLHSIDLGAIEHELKVHLARGLNFFKHAPLVIDLEQIKEQADDLDFTALASSLRNMQLFTVGVRNATPEQEARAVTAGLAVLKGGITQDQERNPEKPAVEELPVATDVSPRRTKIVSQPVRSGQQIYAKGSDLIVLSSVNVGAEVIADGNIHIYGSLRGRAFAGVSEDATARIFAQVMEPELAAIAGNYQVFDEPTASALYGKAAQIYLDDEQLVIAPL